MALQNTPPRPEGYFELKIIETQMQKESFSEPPLSDYQKQLLGNQAATKSFFRAGLLPKGIPQINLSQVSSPGVLWP